MHLDISKADDSIECYYLQHMMECLGFYETLILLNN